jgi:tRNA pseudouridine55 synthase
MVNPALAIDGVLVIDKPAGPTSFEVVREVRSFLKVNKAGHTGTLDPMATGVLPICVGSATRVAGLISEGRKSYDAIVRLGVVTDTQDAAGNKLSESPVPTLSNLLLETTLSRFRGKLLQIPPMYSAVKIGGRRLYGLAREGKEVPREPRPVEVHELKLRDFSSNELTLSLTCSKGFYARTLAHDIGAALGCGAHLRALRRTASGPFTLQQAISLVELRALVEPDRATALKRLEDKLVPISKALEDWPAISVSAEDAQRVAHGVPIEFAAASGQVRVLGPEGRLLAIAEVGAGSRLKYRRVLV